MSGAVYLMGGRLVLEMELLKREDLERIARVVLGSHYQALRVNDEYWQKPLPPGHRRKLRVTVEACLPLTPEELAQLAAEDAREIDDP